VRRKDLAATELADLPVDGHVAVKVWGGLGNRLFMLAAGFSVARSTNRPLVVLSHHQETLSDVVGGLDPDRLFGTLESQPRVALLPRQDHSTVVRAKQKARNVASRLHLVGEPPARGGRVRRVRTNGCESLVMEGYFQDCALVSEATTMGWPTSPPLRAEDESWLASLSEPLQHGVGVHVRRGDYLDKINQFRLGSPDLDYYRAALDKFPTASRTPLWLFSDDPRGATDFLSAGGVHVDRAFGPGDSPSEAAALGLMGISAGLVISNSTFSWWGAFWSKAPRGIVYPRPWHDRVDANALANPLWKAVPKRIQV